MLLECHTLTETDWYNTAANRWVSDQSLRIYAREGRANYSEWLRKAETADVSTVYVHSLPDMDEDAHYARLKSILDNRQLEE